jgi:hypothetical protein
MRTIRIVAHNLAAALTLAVVGLVGTDRAWAHAAPIEPDRPPVHPTTTTTSASGGGVDLWPALPLLLVGVLIGVAVALAVSRLLASGRRQSDRVAPA